MSFFKSRDQQVIFLILSFFSLLVGVRIFKTQSWQFAFLVWNLFLALIPLALAYLTKRSVEKAKPNFSVLSFLILWLLFFPNSAYIITDLMHLSHLPVPLLWYDSLLIFYSALAGMLFGLYSLYLIHKALMLRFNKSISWLLISGFLILSGYGIYLGRFLRLNSWDLFTNPFYISKKILFALEEPRAMHVTLFFALAQFVVYLSFWILKSDKYESAKNAEKLYVCREGVL